MVGLSIFLKSKINSINKKSSKRHKALKKSHKALSNKDNYSLMTINNSYERFFSFFLKCFRNNKTKKIICFCYS